MVNPYKLIVTLGLVSILTLTVKAQRNFYVKPSGLPAATGNNWNDPIALPQALQQAVNADTIRVAEGNYLPALTETFADTTGIYYRTTFSVRPGVTMYGGYPSSATGTDTTGRTFFSTTILNGDLTGNDGANFTNRDDNVIHVVFIQTSSATLPSTIDGFTVRGGNGKYLGPINSPQPVPVGVDSFVVGGTGAYVPDTYHGLHGNGIIVLNNDNATQSQVIIHNCIVTDNQANQGTNNAQNGHSQARGAGIGVENNLQEGCNIHITITQTEVIGNRTVDSLIQSTANDHASSVAGIFIMSGATSTVGRCILIMDRCLISNNQHIGAGPSTRTRAGGGLRFGTGISGSNITFTTFSNNSVVTTQGGNGYGAGLDLYATIEINSCEIINNSISTNAGYAVGAGAQLGTSTLSPVYTIINTTVANNSSNTPGNTTYGGGLYIFGTTNIFNSTISSNKVLAANQSFGSGIGTSAARVELVNTTVANNTGSEGMNVEDVNTFILDNVLFTGNLNAASVAADIVYEGIVNSTISYTIADGLYYGANITTTKPLTITPTIAPLADNGGFGQTHSLLNDCNAYNPAIGTGNPLYRNIPDQDLINRFDIPWNPSIGAVEYPLRADTVLVDTSCGFVQQWNAADLFGDPLTYSIVDPSIASIDQTGLVTNISAGTTQLQVTNGTEIICIDLIVKPTAQTIDNFNLIIPNCTDYGLLIQLPPATSTGLPITYEIIDGLNTVATQYSPTEIKIVSSGNLAVRGFNAGDSCNNPVEEIRATPVSVNPLFLSPPLFDCSSTDVMIQLDNFSSHSASYTYEAFNIQPSGTAAQVTSPNTFQVLTLPPGTTASSFRVTDDITGCISEVPGFVFGCALPVIWLDFYGSSTDNGNMLTWKVADEIDVKQYDVERSSDGNIFYKIGIVEFKASSSQVNTYKFIDANSLNGKIYYRVKQVDQNGRYEYSKVIVIDRNITTFDLRVYPNPSSGKIFFRMQTPKPGGGFTVKMFDIAGRNVWQRQARVEADVILLEESMAGLPKGIYYAQVRYEVNAKIELRTIRIIKAE